MKTCRELEIQDLITEKLLKRDIYPFSAIFSYLAKKDYLGLLSITFYVPQQIYQVLDLLDYKYECDKSGYLIFDETNTLMFSGLALMKLIDKL